jgi:N-methylhydantoinase B
MAEGGPGGRARSVIYRFDGAQEEIKSKIVTELRPGDRLVIETAGGGGWGNPTTRSAEALEDDVANGKVTEPSSRLYRASESRAD